MKIRPYGDADLEAVAAVHAEAFPRQGHSRDWIAATARAYPRIRLYVAEVEGALRGYVAWSEKSGFRAEVVLELEQVAVAERYRGRGFGAALIRESLPDVARQLGERGATLKSVMVSTRADNAAQRLYRKTLGAEVVATLPSLYSADEVILVARKPL
jgi:ribosomal protein S18 acetylase RimI-like enzyme